MLDICQLKEILNTFSKCDTQSEAEVRSKLIVPLIEWLGYPVEYRAEEFPIYSYEYGKSSKAKNADFLLFDDSSFKKHRTKKGSDIEWVQIHSLLIFEAKKAGKMPESLDQPIYYTAFSRSVAYLVSDGIRIKGRIYNPANRDADIIDCLVSDLTSSAIAMFSFESIKELKRKHEEMFQKITKQFIAESSKRTITPIPATEDNINLPDEVWEKMKRSLGKNARGLSKIQLLEKFLRTTDFILENDIRYDVPPHMIDVPRKVLKCKLYLDKVIFPFIAGEALIYYCNEYDRISFISASVTMEFVYKDNALIHSYLSYRVSNPDVSSRINNLQNVENAIDSNQIKLEIEDNGVVSQIISIETEQCLIDRDLEKAYLSIWQDGLSKMKVIEDYFGIKFKLGPIDPGKTFYLYDSVDCVYRGIAKQFNCHVELPGYYSDEEIVVEEPTIVEIKEELQNLRTLIIHNYTFVPKKVYVPKGTIRPSKKPFNADLCIIFEPSENASDNQV